MKLSTKTRYAVRVLFELAQANKALPMGTISQNTGISLRTIEQIIVVLNANNMTKGIIGPGGGIVLEKKIEEISLGDLVYLFEDGIEFVVCCGDKSNDCPNQHTCKTRFMWKKISQKIQDQLNTVSLVDVLFENKINKI
ncbi:RrF2 family transcriptional regulator [Desulfovibrio litoralis]|uniref:Transcriptional regulator, BadM/Rrf2 family n=1 Tax=Desulfovibrio litoralis DSM 11393 TaxID=1121455 RepID=A0A1M7SEU1_9BACT|nr:Rrf2 family transcriptional regulator [Desulfovibrio litoralis]SHN56980.1 transcriptional regulator, BadM/Rrf2 family [Desulfovibrio litoralis DSM 11393]